MKNKTRDAILTTAVLFVFLGVPIIASHIYPEYPQTESKGMDRGLWIGEEAEILYELSLENERILYAAYEELYSDCKDYPYNSEEAAGDCSSILEDALDDASSLTEKAETIRNYIDSTIYGYEE